MNHGQRFYRLPLTIYCTHLADKTNFLFLDFVLVGVILVTHKYKINPDNMATPLAASIGDLIAITMLSISVALLYINLGKN